MGPTPTEGNGCDCIHCRLSAIEERVDRLILRLQAEAKLPKGRQHKP